jgi:hypothetical protein
MVIVALIMMVSSPLLMPRHLRHCQTSVVTLIACCQSGIVGLVMMLLLPLMCRYLCCHCHCNFCPHDNCVITIVDAQVSLSSSSWHCCPCNNGVITLDLQRFYCPHPDGIVAALKLVLLPLLQWHCHHHQHHHPCYLLASWSCCC